MRKPLKALCIIVSSVLLILVLFNAKTIFPFVGDCEYYEEKGRVDRNISYVVIHNAQCPLNHSKWFTRKENKYNILVKQDADFCDECFDEYEIRKLIMLHKLNLRDLYLRYRTHYSEEESLSLIKEYKQFYDND